MNDQMPPAMDQPKKSNTMLIIAIVAVVLLCCCCIAVIIVFTQYDNWGDPLGIYGSLRQLQLRPFA